MSKINSCYPLCPLIDQKSFFGVSDDCESGYVVVTLGKNMVVRYKLMGQKQVNSWSTKLRLSSPVVYDRAEKKYVGIFNSNIIQMWTELDVDLNKVKKYKFKDPIHCILTANQNESSYSPVVIVFKNGSVAPLTYENLNKGKRGDVEYIGMVQLENKCIDDTFMLVSNKNYIIALVCSDLTNKNLVCHLLPLETGLFKPVSFNLSRSSKLSEKGKFNGDIKLTGYIFINGEQLKLLTCWSDGDLYCLDLNTSDSDLNDVDTQFPGNKIMDLSNVFNTQLKVAMLSLDDIGCHVAVYGSDPSEEGALLAILNIKYYLLKSRFNLKLYCMSPRLWSGGKTDLLLIVGQHLAVAHYRLTNQKLAALVGSQTGSCSSTNLLCTDWTKVKCSEKNDILNSNNDLAKSDLFFVEEDMLRFLQNNKSITRCKETVKVLWNEGLSQAGICERLVPTLIETRDTTSLIWLINKFVDIPLHCKINIISYCLAHMNRNENVDKEITSETENNKVTEFFNDERSESKSQQMNILLLVVLTTCLFPDNKALLLVRSELPLASGLKLIEYINDFMIERPGNLRLIEWAILLLDSYYLAIIIGKNKKMIKTLKNLKNCINKQITFMSTWQSVVPLIKMVKSGHVPKNTKENSIYSCDQLNIY